MRYYIDVPDSAHNISGMGRKEMAEYLDMSECKTRLYCSIMQYGEPIEAMPEAAGEVVGIVGDLHAPFIHKRYLDFIKETFARKGVTRIHFAGDIVDNHASSFHTADPDGMGAGAEKNSAIAQLQDWYEAFPEATVSIGNHDAIPWRKAQEAGLSASVLKEYGDMYESPVGWKWEDSTVIDGVLYTHGTGNGGIHPAYNLAKKSINSVVIGHAHSAGGVKYITSKFARIFGLDVGCGMDVDAYAFAYGKHFPTRPILGCGIVRNGIEAEFIPMPLERFKKGA